jgi:hypothetical protein
MAPDYMDVWQGAIDDGWYDALFEDEATGLFHFSTNGGGYERPTPTPTMACT